MADENKKYRCKACGYQTDIVSLGSLYQGCPKCMNRAWQKFENGEWIDYGRTPETDALMRFLGT